jgi:hypothetical protein
VRQQHLGAAQALLAQLGFVHLRQAHLTDGCSRLQFVDLAGALRPAQALHALGNGAAGHHDDLARHLCVAGQQRHLAAPFADRASSRPRPSLVTRLEPTLMTMRRACRSTPDTVF